MGLHWPGGLTWEVWPSKGVLGSAWPVTPRDVPQPGQLREVYVPCPTPHPQHGCGATGETGVVWKDTGKWWDILGLGSRPCFNHPGVLDHTQSPGEGTRLYWEALVHTGRQRFGLYWEQ